MELRETHTTVSVEMTLHEIEYIRRMTQNYMAGPEESSTDFQTRLSLFVGSSRILGYDMEDDGSIKKAKEIIAILDQ
jgi:hypothetical protein